MKKLILFLLITSAAFMFAGFKACNDSNSDGVFRNRLYDDKKAVTPKGAKVGSRTSIPANLLPEIDKGLDRLFEIASAPPNNYSGFATHASYAVWLFPRSPRCENPSFLVEATGSPYDGSEYDKDPGPRTLICAAGMMVLQPNLEPGMVVSDDLAQMATIVRYEGEHNLLLQVDSQRYNDTQYHLGSGHPILGEGQQASRRASKEAEFQAVAFEVKGTKYCVLITK